MSKIKTNNVKLKKTLVCVRFIWEFKIKLFGKDKLVLVYFLPHGSQTGWGSPQCLPVLILTKRNSHSSLTSYHSVSHPKSVSHSTHNISVYLWLQLSSPGFLAQRSRLVNGHHLACVGLFVAWLTFPQAAGFWRACNTSLTQQIA